MNGLRDKAAIVGIGETTYSKNSGMSYQALLLQAATRAIEDAGLEAKEIDAIIPPCFGAPAETFAVNLGIEDLRYTASIRLGGAAAVASLETAAMLVATGVARNVLSVTGWNGYSGFRLREMGSVWDLSLTMIPIMREFEHPFGFFLPAQWFGIMARRHMHEYGTTSRQFGAVAVTMRKHAILNDNATMKKPITIEDHHNSRIIAEPFRLLDCCLESDGAAAAVITSTEGAKELRHRPIYIMGAAQGRPDSPDFIAARPSITETGVRRAAPRAFATAGITPADIDVAEIYDCFTWTVICQIEDVGFCPKGEGGPFVEGGRIELGGELPVNTHGGLLSQAHVLGMNHIVEAVKQLRGTAGKAQVEDAEIALVTGFGDIGDGSVAILRR